MRHVLWPAPFTAAQARDFGLTTHELTELVRDGQLRRPLRGVYVDSGLVDSRELRVACLELVKPEHAVACSETAAWVMGIDAFRPSDRHLLKPSFLVPHAQSRIRREQVSCRQAIVPDSDIVMLGELRVTSPVRTLSDLLRRLYRPYALAAGDAFVRAGLVEYAQIFQHVQQLKGFPGIVQARSLVARLDGRAESPGESWQRLRIIDAGFPVPELQVVVEDPDGRERRLDMAYTELLIASEFDGREFHTHDDDVAADRVRRDSLSWLGWRWVNGRRERIFGSDTSFERELGALLGMEPMSRFWGHW